jgi:hypothetical protein
MDSIITFEMLIITSGDSLIIWIELTITLQWSISFNYLVEEIFDRLNIIEILRSLNKDKKYRKSCTVGIEYDSIVNRRWYKINAYKIR